MNLLANSRTLHVAISGWKNCSNSPNKKFILFYNSSLVNNWLN
ncbi:Uncharacterised protein [Vibrio cholerae]|nr:Uncharacterised protein [Vibrio cholerae]